MKLAGATEFQSAGWWSWRGTWVHLQGPVLYDNATGLGSCSPSVMLLPQSPLQSQSASLLFCPSQRSGKTCGQLLAPMADVMPVPVRDRLTPSRIPPAFSSWGLCGWSRLIPGISACKASFSGPGLSPVEVGKHVYTRASDDGQPCPHGHQGPPQRAL